MHDRASFIALIRFIALYWFAAFERQSYLEKVFASLVRLISSMPQIQNTLSVNEEIISPRHRGSIWKPKDIIFALFELSVYLQPGWIWQPPSRGSCLEDSWRKQSWSPWQPGRRPIQSTAETTWPKNRHSNL